LVLVTKHLANITRIWPLGFTQTHDPSAQITEDGVLANAEMVGAPEHMVGALEFFQTGAILYGADGDFKGYD